MHWTAVDLEQRLATSLEVAERATRFLGENGWQADGEGVRPEKVLCETALFLLATRDACGTSKDLAHRHRRIATALVPFARNPRIAALIALEPVVALDHALMHLCLARMGLADERFDRLLASAVGSQGAAARERLPHRRMEQQWLRRLMTQSDAPIDPLLRARDCILDHSLDALSPPPDDLYAFTHCLLFGTDLGMRTARFRRGHAAIAADAEAATARCLDLQDFDIAGELLMTWPLLRRRWSPWAAFAFACLLRAEDTAGFLPAPGMSLQHAAALSGIDRTRHLLAQSYHTIYVMGMLCALALRTGATPPRLRRARSRHGSEHRGGAIGALLAMPDPTAQHRPVWRSVLDSLAATDQDALSPFVLTVQLQRAAARRDLGGIQDILRIAARFDLLGLPAPRQALELLQRATLLPDVEPARHEAACA